MLGLTTHVKRTYRATMTFLDARGFPAVVRYTTHPLVILTTILLLVPLIVFATATALVLIGNTYLNVASASVSSIVLAQSLKHHHEVKRMHAAHQADIAALHAKIDALAPPANLPVRPTHASTPAPTPKARTLATVHTKSKP